LEECGLIIGRPNAVAPGAAIQPPAAFAWIDCDQSAIKAA
jgi:hypothetical protein